MLPLEPELGDGVLVLLSVSLVVGCVVSVLVCVDSSLVGRPELGADAAVVVSAGEEPGAVGTYPTKNCMLSPVL